MHDPSTEQRIKAMDVEKCIELLMRIARDNEYGGRCKTVRYLFHFPTGQGVISPKD